jgi:membrane protein YdbS with pleckstrin-like domain
MRRRDGRRWRVLTPPEEIIEGYLTADEQFILVDEPSNRAFMVAASNEIMLIVALGLVTLMLVAKGAGVIVGILGFLAVDVIVVLLVWRRLQAFYTRYVLTDFRVIRSWGVLNRQMAWIPWSKVTDVSISQSLSGRMLGYATVRIESANEDSGFKEIKDLCEPHRFHRYIAEIVEAKQGKTVPRWLQPAEAVNQPLS